MSILQQVEASLADFRPRNQLEFIALQISHRLKDTPNLATYLLASQRFTKAQLLNAVPGHDGPEAPKLFFRTLDGLRKEAE